jgi:bifunctional UDP-N-acetylglucosamine pyrophosphorylase/glucosamine-1-phosphate N-acetyltransferase
MSFASIILAAGKGTRMASTLPKPLHRVSGKPMLGWVLDTCYAAGSNRLVVVIPKENAENTEEIGEENNETINQFVNQYREHHAIDVTAATQYPPKGTGHAVECAKDALKTYKGIAIVAFADTPLVYADTYADLAYALENEPRADIACLGFTTSAPSGYGRMVQDNEGNLLKIVEEAQANTEEKAIELVNAGIMALRLPQAFDLLEGIGYSSNKGDGDGEKYLTECIEAAQAKGRRVLIRVADETEVMGINDRQQLAEAESVMQIYLRNNAMAAGATFIAPETVFLHYDTVLEPDVIVEPHVVFGPGVYIGRGSEIKSFSHLEGTTTGACCVIGPYARLRPWTQFGEGVKIGNFVEVKNTAMGDLAKANHLAYLGDATIGGEVNIGAGTITCNYDGTDKHHTQIGDGAFIGSNSSLVAPVTIGAGAIVGAGSTITRNVEGDDLAVSRAETRSVEKGAARLRKRQKKT